jgi:hypothetical protein
MGDYRHIDTGEIKSQGQWRSHYKNTSLPRTWTAATLDGLKLEPVFETPKPDAGQYQNAVRNGVEKDANGNWVWAWAIRDMFSDYTDEDGVTHTKAEQEAAYQAQLDAVAAKAVRDQRGKLLAETDWVVVFHTEKGTNIPFEWEAYRQALRDISNHVNFPHLAEDDWPVKP